jgi:muconolactone delta-isomerase
MLEVQLEEMKYLARLRDEGKIAKVWKVPAGPGQSVWLLDSVTHEEIDQMVNQMPDFPHFIFDIRIIPLSSLAATEETMKQALETRRMKQSPS